MKVIASIEYEVDDGSTLKQALNAIRDMSHVSKYSTKAYDTAKFRAVRKVAKKVRTAK